MTQTASPILTSLLDTDAYKLHMQQAVFHHYKTLPVTAEFVCRGDESLLEYRDEIRQQIDLMGELALTEDEFNYLTSLPFFKADYLAWLREFRFKPQQVTIGEQNGRLSLEIAGNWLDVILWEVPLLAVISEIVHRKRSPFATVDMAVTQLKRELAHFKKCSQDIDLSHFQMMDFGTRRRFSHDVQKAILQTLHSDFPYLMGTSNYQFAQQMKLTPVGTQAHEWFQAHQQITPTLQESQRVALQVWQDEYPEQLAIALTDCITMDAFLRDFNLAFAKHYQGLRHDSGDPVEWGEKAIAHFIALGIDPMSKTLVFSDGLDFNQALRLYRHFVGKINIVFGIGTKLTCNIPDVTALNIVIKLVSCNGKPVAKLSDSPGKTICHDPQFVCDLRRAFDLPKTDECPL